MSVDRAITNGLKAMSDTLNAMQTEIQGSPKPYKTTAIQLRQISRDAESLAVSCDDAASAPGKGVRS